MVNQAAAGAVIVASEVRDMAVGALASAVSGRAYAGTGSGAVTGLTTTCLVDFATAGKGRAIGTVTADAVRHFGCRGNIDGDCCRMAMAVAVEVGAMALDAGAASTAVDGGVAVAVDTNSAKTIGWVMAGGARGVDAGDPIAYVAVHAQGGGGHRGAVVVAVSVEISRMTLGAGCTPEDGGDLWSVDRQLQGRRRGMTVRALVGVDHKRAVCRVTDGDAGWVIQDDAGPGRRVVNRQMHGRCCLIQMTVQAINR